MCGDGNCYESYADCEPLEGCTDIFNFLMCPNGNCVSNFDDCIEKIYDCPLKGQTRCGDGVCREACEGIPTNGCPSDKPVYCQNGVCVQFYNQCFDFRCELEKPIFCSNLQCRESFDACPINAQSSMIKDVQVEVYAHANSSILENIEVFSQKDPNELKLLLKTERKDLYFPEYTALYQINDENNKDYNECEVEILPLPKSDLNETRLNYTQMDIHVEAFSNKLFRRSLTNLLPFQFMRSFAFEFKIRKGGNSNLLFNNPIEALIQFNIIYGYPNTGLGGDIEDEDDEEEEGENNDSEIKQMVDIIYPNDEPEKIYCLGMLDPVKNTWSCINRKIIEINEDGIIYELPCPGIFTILFFPLPSGGEEELCGWLCQNKKEVTTFFIFYLPLILLFIAYFSFIVKKLWREAQITLKKFEKNMKKQYKKLQKKAEELKKFKDKEKKEEKEKNDYDPFNEDDNDENNDEDDDEDNKGKDELGFSITNKMNQFKYMEKMKIDKNDSKNIQEIINGDNFEVKGKTLTFINPLIFNKRAQSSEGKEIQDAEEKKIELKFKNEDLLAKN